MQDVESSCASFHCSWAFGVGDVRGSNSFGVGLYLSVTVIFTGEIIWR